MKFGLYGINVGICSDPEVSARVARAAEDAGFDSLWTAEHVVLPDPQVPPSPLGPHHVSWSQLGSGTRTSRPRMAPESPFSSAVSF